MRTCFRVFFFKQHFELVEFSCDLLTRCCLQGPVLGVFSSCSQSESQQRGTEWGSSFPHLPCSCIFAFAAPHHFSNCSVLAALLLLTLLISYSSCFSLWSFPAATDEAWKYSQWINWEANYTGGSPRPSHMFAALLMPLVLSDSPGSLWKRLNACFSLPQSVGVN